MTLAWVHKVLTTNGLAGPPCICHYLSKEGAQLIIVAGVPQVIDHADLLVGSGQELIGAELFVCIIAITLAKFLTKLIGQ